MAYYPPPGAPTVPGYPVSSTGGYAPAPQPGYPAPGAPAGYTGPPAHPAQPGYPPQAAGYPAQVGYPTGVAAPPVSTTYPAATAAAPTLGYPAQPGYPPAQPGYQEAKPGYPPAQPAYPPASAQPAYPAAAPAAQPVVHHDAPPPSYTDVLTQQFPSPGQPVVADPTGVLAKLYHGAKIHLTSIATRKNLRILGDGTVNGLGGCGIFATFFVEKVSGKPQDVIRLRNANNPQYYLNIIQSQLVASNGATETSLLRVKPNKGDSICLESCVCPGQHVGILPSGSVKPAKATGRGPHGQFTVVTAADPSQAMALLQPESKIHLVSVATNKSLRILGNGTINGQGGFGAFATFFVEKPAGQTYDTIRLRSANNPCFYINIINAQLVSSNGATATSLLRVKPHADGNVSLESVCAPGQHVGILPTGQPKPANNTGMGPHGQFSMRKA
eukprot:scpid60368/ scgid29572/ 